MDQQLTDLREIALRHAQGSRVETIIPNVRINTGTSTTGPLPGLVQPVFCLVLQGAKEVMIGDRLLRYDQASYFIASLTLPATGRITQASPERPYLAASMTLDSQELAALLTDLQPRPEGEPAGFAISPVTPELLDPWLRLLRLLDTPGDAPVLSPLIRREILYRLFQGPQGGVLRQIACADSRLSHLRRAISWIGEHYDQPLRVDALAALAAMSPASFHRHFKTATAMSPLQYQKSLRLQQARRLLMADEDASRAGYAVGYESASQFSREYARLFGAPPARDAARLRSDGASREEIGSAA